MKKDFVHLHLHTEYSLLDGAIKIKDLFKRLLEFNMKSVAITDHGVMCGIIDFYKEAKKNGIKPIIGCEVYTAPKSRWDKQHGEHYNYGHLVLLAKNAVGYKNLIKIVSTGFVEGFYYKPRVDNEVLSQYSEGIIALSACLAGNIPRHILNNNYQAAKNTALSFNDIFGYGNFYLELQDHGIADQKLVNNEIIQISKETGIPLVATNDAHYLEKRHSKSHEILLCIQTGKTITDEDRMQFSGDEFYVKSSSEMYDVFSHVPQALENTLKIAEECNVEFEFGKVYLPQYKVPNNADPFEYLKQLCIDGINKIYDSNVTKKAIFDRLEYELNVIKCMGYVDYFLIVWDLIKYAKDAGIMVGPGRGSAAGSIVAYSLGITTVDPLKYNLLFERFLNPERISMPDIDIDFCFERRPEVIDYAVKTYGTDRVAQIITFGTMAARAAIRDVGRALAIPYNEVDWIAKAVPFQIGMTIDKALEINPELKNKYEQDQKTAELIDMAKALEGMPRHSSTHAAGVIISKDPIMEHVPIQNTESGFTTQFTMGILEELGLLKIDFLGLRTLTVIRDAINLIEKNYAKKINFQALEMDDANVFKLISEGKTLGIFQLEGTGMAQFMKELKPSSFEDIIAGISLYRPGPMDQIPRYIKNKNNPENIKYHHPSLEKILDVTYGCIVYQEQVMQIVRDLAGFSMGRADLVRRAMSKKKVSVMEEERHNFIHGLIDKEGNVIASGAIKNGVAEQIAIKIFDEIMDFASYAFNKSHGAAYAVIAYQTAWLKYYYPVEFMAALLNSFLTNNDKISVYINECRTTMGIDLLPPDINESDAKFTVVKGKIRFGMAAIKNVGEGVIDTMVKERSKNGPYKSFNDFCERIYNTDINKRCVENLIKSGAFDSLGCYRSKLLATYGGLIDSIANSKKNVAEGQLTLFDLFVDNLGIDVHNCCAIDMYPNLSEFSKKELLSMEKEILGLYVSGHPLKEYEKDLFAQATHTSSDFTNYLETNFDETGEIIPKISKNSIKDGMIVTVGGVITSKKTKLSKNNNLVGFITLEDLNGSIEIIVFASVFEKYSMLLIEENIVLITGRVSLREDEQPKIICDKVNPINKVAVRKLYLRVTDINDISVIKPITALLKFFCGSTPVYIYSIKDNQVYQTGKDCWVDLTDEILDELRSRIGKENVKIVE